jgi:hypothetical protein
MGKGDVNPWSSTSRYCDHVVAGKLKLILPFNVNTCSPFENVLNAGRLPNWKVIPCELVITVCMPTCIFSFHCQISWQWYCTFQVRKRKWLWSLFVNCNMSNNDVVDVRACHCRISGAHRICRIVWLLIKYICHQCFEVTVKLLAIDCLVKSQPVWELPLTCSPPAPFVSVNHLVVEDLVDICVNFLGVFHVS